MSAPRDSCWVYDFLLTRGGAETVTLDLARRLPQIDVWVAARNPRVPLAGATVRTLARRPPSRHALLRALQTRRLFRRHAATLGAYARVVYSGMFAPVAQLTAPAGHAIYYCHTTPLPYAYDWQGDYRARLPGPARALFDRFARRERALFARAIAAMDSVVANSEFVARRYLHHLGIIPEVVYPPVAVDAFHWREPQDYFVLLASLEPHKRVGLAIEAFRGRSEALVIAGEGSQLKRLQRLAAGHANVEFLGAISRDRVVELLAGCRASLCLSRGEAFGLAAAESLAAGKPVIAVAEGAYPEMIEPGVSGCLIDPEVAAVSGALDALTARAAARMRDACRRVAERYRPERFYARIARLLQGR